jgi:hypothetical protein
MSFHASDSSEIIAEICHENNLEEIVNIDNEVDNERFDQRENDAVAAMNLKDPLFSGDNTFQGSEIVENDEVAAIKVKDPLCCGDKTIQGQSLWMLDEIRRNEKSVCGQELEQKVAYIIESCTIHNEMSKYLSIVAECYGEEGTENISIYVATRITGFENMGITKVEQVIMKIDEVSCITFDRLDRIDTNLEITENHTEEDENKYYVNVPMTSLEKRLLLEAGVYWLQNEYKLSTSLI